jgi:hypothetical protein
MHLVWLRTSAINRAHGVLTQFGVRVAFGRLRRPDAGELLERRCVPEMWRRSVTKRRPSSSTWTGAWRRWSGNCGRRPMPTRASVCW